MAKTRRKKIAEVVADPIKKKEAPVDTRSDEQKVFDMGLKVPRTVSDDAYDNSPGEVEEKNGSFTFNSGDYRLANQMKQEDEADKLKPGKSNKAIPDYTQYTATSGAKKTNDFWNESSGIYKSAMAARKETEQGIPTRNQPSLDNPTGKGYRDFDKNNTSEGSKVAEAMNNPKEEYSRPSRKGDENIYPANESKPNEDMGKQQNKVAGDGSKAAEVVSKTPEVTTPTTEEEEPLLGGNSVTIDAGIGGGVTTTGNGQYVKPESREVVVKTNPGAALNNAIQSNTAAQTTSNAVLKAGIDNAETAGQVFEAPKVAEEAKKEAEKIQANLDVNAVNAFTNMSEEQKQAYGQATANQLDNQTANELVAPAAYNAVTGGSTGPIRPPYEAITNKDQVEKDITDQYRNLDSSIPQAVVEKLGVQDYYPEIGRDIAVGTFTGSRIGSQTIYSGAGGLLPQGLYDARKRALNEAAKAKNAALDKYYSGIDIAAQFKPKFNETVNDAMDNLLYKKHGGNVNAFLADPESRREFSRLEAVAKNVNHYDAYATSVLKDAADDTKFIDAEQIKNAQDIKRALVDDVDGVLNGKKDLSSLFAKAQVYQNMIPQIDKVLDDVLAEGRIGKLPINMRTGGVYNDPKFVSERDQFMQKLNDGTLDQAHYISGFKKFFTGDYERIIDGMVQSGKYSDLQKEAAMNYFAGHLQEQVDLKNEFVATGNTAAARLRLDRDKFNYQKQSDKESYFGTINANLNDAVNNQTGKTFNQEIAELQKSGLTGKALNDAIGTVWKQYGYGAAKLNSKGYYSTVIPSSQALSKDITAKDVYINGKPQRTIKVAIHVKNKNTGKWDWQEKEMTPSEISAYRSKVSQVDKYGKISKQGDYALYAVDEGGVKTKMSASDLENYGKAQSTVFTKVVSHQIAKGYFDAKGRFHFLNDQNIGAYTSSNRQATLVRDIEQPYSKTPSHNDKTMQVNYVEELLPGQMVGEWTRIDNQAGQQNKDQQSGYKVNQAAEAQGGPDSSSGSGESGGFNMSTPQ
jgi:hypothetical protein